MSDFKATLKSVKSIMQKRTLVPASAINKRVRLLIQGNGNVIEVTDKQGNPVPRADGSGEILTKRIFNVRANSELAMKNARNIETLKAAVAAEKAGDAEKAHELFNEYLNKCQISFGVLLPSAIADKLGGGVEIAAQIVRVDTDNGSLLTIEPDTISVVEPEVYGSTSFNIDALMGEEEEADEDELTSLDRAGLVKFAKDNKLTTVKVKPSMSDDDIRQLIRAAQATA